MALRRFMRKRIILTAISLLVTVTMYSEVVSGTSECNDGNKALKEYSKKGSRLSLSKAIEKFKSSAKEDNAEACYSLYRIYSLQSVNGIGVDPQDVQWVENGQWDNLVHSEWPTQAIAYSYLKKASDLGYVDAACDLAIGYLDGRWNRFENISEDVAKQKAYQICIKYQYVGNSGIECLLGKFYEYGIGMDIDIPKAIFWYNQAFEHGADDIALTIGNLYYSQTDYAMAEKMFSRYFHALQKDRSIDSIFKNQIWKVMRWAEACAGANDFDKALAIMNKYLEPKVSGISGMDLKNWNPKKLDELYGFESRIEDFYQHHGGALQSAILRHIYSTDPDPSPEISYMRARNIISFNSDYSLIDRERNFIIAMDWLEKAKTYKDETGSFCIWVGQSFSKENKVSKAQEWFERAVSHQEIMAYKYLAQLYENNARMLKDEDHHKAFDCWKRLADANDAYGLYQIGRYYEDGKLSSPDIDKARYYYELSANQNDGEASLYAMDNLASCLIRQDRWDQAFEWLNKAYQQGFLPVCHNLGDLYYYGHGTAQSYIKAFELFSKGADSNVACKYRLAVMYREGLGTDKDVEKSSKLLKECADMGYGRAQYLIGMDYYDGKYQQQNYGKAVKCLTDALENKYVPDVVKGALCRTLASCYRFGRGVESDEYKADDFMQMAASYGDEKAAMVMEWLHMK